MCGIDVHEVSPKEQKILQEKKKKTKEQGMVGDGWVLKDGGNMG